MRPAGPDCSDAPLPPRNLTKAATKPEEAISTGALPVRTGKPPRTPGSAAPCVTTALAAPQHAEAAGERRLQRPATAALEGLGSHKVDEYENSKSFTFAKHGPGGGGDAVRGRTR